MFMKALLLIIVVLFGATVSIVAQKKGTLMGDIVIGEVTKKDEATREITLTYPGKEGTEIFSGFLVDGYKLRMAEGSLRELNLSELTPGMYIRMYYKTGSAKVGGQEKKINKITKIEVLGNDKHFRIRNQLNLDPSTTIAPAENGDDLPATSPLKIYLATPFDRVHQQLVAWIDKWNRKSGDSLGKLEVVSDLDHADTLIVVARGADTSVANLPVPNPDGRGVAGVWSHATLYLAIKDAGGLKVLWTDVATVFSSPNAESSARAAESVSAEIEKRLKARTRNSKK